MPNAPMPNNPNRPMAPAPAPVAKPQTYEEWLAEDAANHNAVGEAAAKAGIQVDTGSVDYSDAEYVLPGEQQTG